MPPPQPGYLLIVEQSGQCPPAEARAKRFGLPPKRAAVLHLLTEGKSYAEIGEALGVSPRTVGKHVVLLYRDLGVDNRTAAVARAYEATT